jgi:hypothetical protein
MIKSFRQRIRLFSPEPKTETPPTVFRHDEKNGLRFKVLDAAPYAPDPPSQQRIQDQQEILLEKILAGSR